MKFLKNKLNGVVCVYCSQAINLNRPTVVFPVGGKAHASCYDRAHTILMNDRKTPDEWILLIETWLKENRREYYSCVDIMAEALNLPKLEIDNVIQKRIGGIFHHIGFSKKKISLNGKRPAFYFPPRNFWGDKCN